MKFTTILTILALAASALAAYSQDAGGPTPAGPTPPGPAGPSDGQGGPGLSGRRPVPSRLMQALDLNHDGVIDADEIANAPAALKTLDKNGDGQLTPDELSPKSLPRTGRPSTSEVKPTGPPPGSR